MSDFRNAYLSGLLLQMTRTLLESVERCERHDPWLVARDREKFARIERVLATEGWTASDLQAALYEQVPA